VENVIRRMEAIYDPSFSPLEGKLATSYRTAERINNKRVAIDRIHKLHEEPMASILSPPLYTKRPLTPPPSSPKRKRDQRLSVGERNYKVRKKWVPKQKHRLEENQGTSDPSQESVRRSFRTRSKLNYNVLPKDDAMEE